MNTIGLVVRLIPRLLPVIPVSIYPAVVLNASGKTPILVVPPIATPGVALKVNVGVPGISVPNSVIPAVFDRLIAANIRNVSIGINPVVAEVDIAEFIMAVGDSRAVAVAVSVMPSLKTL